MLPVEVLINEHRLIEKMVSLLEKEIRRIEASATADTDFIDAIVDFFRTYADRYHHGKEEGILFKALSGKNLSDVHHKMMIELVMEHAFARKTVKSLERSNKEYAAGKKEDLNAIRHMLEELIKLYPRHIRKEDKQFFIPCMKYLTQEEQEAMLGNFMEFDRNFTDESYKRIVEGLTF